MVTGRVGQSSAAAGPANAPRPPSAATATVLSIFDLPSRALVRRYAACLNGRGPFFKFARNELGEVFRAPAFRGWDVEAKSLEPFAHPRHIQHIARRLGEAAN